MFHLSMQLWLLAFLLFSRSAVAEVDPIIVKGSHFFYSSNGTQFLIRGVNFQDPSVDLPQTFKDPLAEGDDCDRAIVELLQLKTNVIYVEAIDPQQEHSVCMEAFADAGIYVLVSLVPPSLLDYRPDAAWDTTAYNYSTATIDTMGKYTNLLGFYAPRFNLYVNNDPVLPIMKAMVRDAKAYIASKTMRQIPVGSVTETTWSNASFVDHALDFLSCDDIHSDFISVSNTRYYCPSVEWIEDSGRRFERASMPVILQSPGCNDSDSERVKALYSQNALSGGILYSFYYESIFSGLVDRSPQYSWVLVERQLFKDVKSVMATQTVSSMNIAEYTVPASKTTNCPTSADDWPAVGATLAPPPSGRLCNCMMQTLECTGNSVVIGKLLDKGSLMPTFFETLCGKNRDRCAGTGTNPATGTYGAFSACSRDERLSWDMSWWSKYNSSSDGDCKLKGNIDKYVGNLSDYDGIMTRQTPTLNLDAECKFLLDQAGVNGTGTITDFQLEKATPAPTSSSTTNSTLNGDGSNGLSIGAKAGIGLGGAAVVIMALLLVLFVLHRKKKSTKQNHENLDKGGHEEQPLKAELEGRSVPEMDGEGKVAEVPYMNATPWELPVNEQPVEMYAPNENSGVGNSQVRDGEVVR